MVIRFDLSSITDISLIDSVKLALYSIGAKGENACSLFVITSDWDTDVTWNNRKNSTAWNTVGGDYDPQSLVQVDVPDYYQTWEEFDVTSHVMDMLNGNISNFGFLIKVDYCSTTDYKNWRKHASSQYSDQALRPKLVFYADEFPDIDPPVVNITSPGGDDLSPNTTHNIIWTAVDDVGVVSRALYFSSDNGGTWTKLDSAETNTGTYPWTVPELENSACKIRIFAYDLAGNQGGDTSRTFSIGDDVAPSVTVDAPTASEELNKGTTYAITWTATDNVTVVSRQIYYICSGQSWTLIDDSDGNTGTFDWTIPDGDKINCRIQVKVFDGAGLSAYNFSGLFEIGDFLAPEVTVSKPAEGEDVEQGTTCQITWTATDNIAVASRAIHFTSDGSTWTRLDSAAGNTGTWDWTVPVLESADCKITVNVYDAAGNSGNSTTGVFNIVDLNAPTVAILTPQESDDIELGTPFDITWTAENRAGVVSRAIYFSLNGTDYSLLDSAAGNTGTYDWAVPEIVSTTCKVKVYAYDASGNQGNSTSGAFNIVDLEAPAVTILTPTASVVLEQASTYDITWTATDNIDVTSRAIYFSSDEGASWELIDSAAGNSGTFEWTVSTIESERCLVKIFAYDAAGNVGSQESGKFTIEIPTSLIPNAFTHGYTGKYKVTVTNLQGRIVAEFETRDINNFSGIRNRVSSGVHIINITAQGRSVTLRRCLIK